MSLRQEQWRAILQNALAQYDRRDAQKLALAAVVSWEQLTSRLIPLLGPDSVYLIYRRSLDLNKSVFPWLPMESEIHPFRARFADLRQCLEQQPVDDSLRANFCLLYTFVEVLAALIGERLATDMLRAAFAKAVAPDPPKETSE